MEIFMIYLLLCLLFLFIYRDSYYFFFMDVPTQLSEIASALWERNKMEKEKLKIMKNNNET